MTRGIDHLVLCVRDLNEAMEFYQQLGFTTTPRAQHPWGTDNFLVQFDQCFVEVLAVARPDAIVPSSPGVFSFGEYNQRFLARSCTTVDASGLLTTTPTAAEGISMLVFESHDARADREVFSGAGLVDYDNFDFERKATLPDGTQATVSFSLAFAVRENMPWAVAFTCQQHAPQYFWRPEFQTHANGAKGIAEVMMLAEEPLDLRDFYSAIQGSSAPTTMEGNRLVVSTSRGRVTVRPPAPLPGGWGSVVYHGSPSFVGYAVDVESLSEVEERLGSEGIPYKLGSGVVRVNAVHAHGCLVEFRAAKD